MTLAAAALGAFAAVRLARPRAPRLPPHRGRDGRRLRGLPVLGVRHPLPVRPLRRRRCRSRWSDGRRCAPSWACSWTALSASCPTPPSSCWPSPALPLLLRRGHRDRWALALLGLGVLLPVLGWRNWFGFSPPARFTVPLVPLLALAVAARLSVAPGRGLARWRWGLVAAGFALAVFMFAEPRAMRMVNGRDGPLPAPSRRSRGEASLARYLPYLSSRAGSDGPAVGAAAERGAGGGGLGRRARPPPAARPRRARARPRGRLVPRPCPADPPLPRRLGRGGPLGAAGAARPAPRPARYRFVMRSAPPR